MSYGLKAGERIFVRREEVVLLEGRENKTTNVNDARSVLEVETVLASNESKILGGAAVARAIKDVLA